VTQRRRLGGAMAMLGAVIVTGTIGYTIMGFTLLDALYQTVNTISTVGFREVHPLSSNGKVFTILLILGGVGAALYAFTVLFETILEGQLNDLLGRRRMQHNIASMRDHVIICGWGRVGRSIGAEVLATEQHVVVVDLNPSDVDHPGCSVVVGDAADDEVLRSAGIERATALVAAVENDAANSFIVLSARALRPDLFIVARARSTDSERKLLRAGADRVVNPQSIGGARMAAFVLRPHVAEFVDVVMHERNVEFRLEEVVICDGSPIADTSLRDAHLRDQTGAMVLALRDADGSFHTNPPPDTVMRVG
jgi:voltage-gated potassium channel